MVPVRRIPLFYSRAPVLPHNSKQAAAGPSVVVNIGGVRSDEGYAAAYKTLFGRKCAPRQPRAAMLPGERLDAALWSGRSCTGVAQCPRSTWGNSCAL
jgi:hypothetical protein